MGRCVGRAHLVDRAALQALLDVVRHPLEVAQQEERHDDDHERERDLPEPAGSDAG